MYKHSQTTETTTDFNTTIEMNSTAINAIVPKGSVFKFGRSTCNEFRSLKGECIKKDGMFHLEIALKWEEDLVFTLATFEHLTPHRTLRCNYEKDSTYIKLFFHPKDLKYVQYCMALNVKSLKQSLYVETRLPFLLKGLMWEEGDLFWVCYTELCKEIPLNYFYKKRFNGDNTSLSDRLRIEGLFKQFLVFLGKCAKKNELKVEECNWRTGAASLDPLLRSVSNFLCTLAKLARRSNNRAKNIELSKMNCHGHRDLISFYQMGNPEIRKFLETLKNFGGELPRQFTFSVTVEEMIKIYGTIFTNLDYKAFVKTYDIELMEPRFKTEKARVDRRKQRKDVKRKHHKKYKAKLDVGHRFQPDAKMGKRVKQKLDDLREEYQRISQLDKYNGDTDDEKYQLHALIVLLDAFTLFNYKEREDDSCNTRLYTYIYDAIQHKRYKKSPLYVPVVNNKEEFDKLEYTLPFYNGIRQWEVNDKWKEKFVEKNKFKLK